MCQLWRRIVAAVLLTGGMVGCATLPDSVAGRHGVATASIMPAVHWSLEEEAGRMESVDPGIRLIPTEVRKCRCEMLSNQPVEIEPPARGIFFDIPRAGSFLWGEEKMPRALPLDPTRTRVLDLGFAIARGEGHHGLKEDRFRMNSCLKVSYSRPSSFY